MAVCLICYETAAVIKQHNISRHFEVKHANYNNMLQLHLFAYGLAPHVAHQSRSLATPALQEALEGNMAFFHTRGYEKKSIEHKSNSGRAITKVH